MSTTVAKRKGRHGKNSVGRAGRAGDEGRSTKSRGPREAVTNGAGRNHPGRVAQDSEQAQVTTSAHPVLFMCA
jgi:hypothetical protein